MAAAAGAVHGTGFTGAPGRIFWKPSTMTCSPAFRPSSTIHCEPTEPPMRTGRGAGLLPSPTTSTVSPLAARVTACCGSSTAPLICPCTSRVRTYMPGSRRACGLATSARSVTCAEVGSTERSENSSRPRCGSSLPSSSTMRTGADSAGALPPPAARSRATSATACVTLT